MKLCVDCKWHVLEGADYLCSKSIQTYISVVDGKTTRSYPDSCFRQRSIFGECKDEGFLWEAK